MGKLLAALSLAIFLAPNIFSDNVHLKNGNTYLNVKIIEEKEDYIVIQFNKEQGTIQRVSILKIEKADYNPDMPSRLTGPGIIEPAPDQPEIKQPEIKQSLIPERQIQTVRPYKNLLFVGILGVVLAWDNFSDASDIGSMINSYKNLGLDANTLESQQTRKSIVGAVAAIIGLAAIAISMKEVEVKANGNTLTVSYGF
jgi:hypothetical protein